MATKQEVSQAHLSVEEKRRALNDYWAKALDEEGNFDWTFGDPATNVYSVRIWVGYDEEDNVKVDIIYPASENAITEDEEGPTDRELETLENLAYETAHLLDTDVPSFAHGMLSYLSSLTPSESFIDTLWDEWIRAKAVSATVTANYKIALKQNEEEVQKKKKDKEKEKRSALVAYWRERRLVKGLTRLQHEKQMAKEELVRQKQRIMEAMEQEFQSFGYYVETVEARESPYLLWSNRGLESSSLVESQLLRLTFVEEVNLSENSLMTLPSALLQLPSLKRLFLHSNCLRLLPDFSGVPLLEILDLHNNEISVLPTDLSQLKHLRVLDLERNKLRIIPEEIRDLDGLHHLDLSRNLIKIIPTALTELKQLTYLNLKLNPIVNLPPHIYIQGTAASMKYLRDQTDITTIQPSSLISDFSLLLSERNGFLADLILRPKDFNQISAKKFLVHSMILASRCLVLANLLLEAQKGIRTVHLDSQTGLPTLDVDLDQDQLAMLVTYIYTDQFTKPELPLLTTSPAMTEAQIVEAIKQNQILTIAFTESLARASETAVVFKLPHLQYLVDLNRKPVEPVESTLIDDFKRVFKSITSTEAGIPSIPPISTPKESSSIKMPFIDPATKIVATDVSFCFPAHPEFPPIKAHKIVLCARSKFFSSLLTGGLVESKQEVVPINEIEPSVFASLIEFCYTDDVYELSGETIMDLLMASRLYGLDRLQGIVESVVGYSLDAANVCGILSISVLYSLKKLGKACKFFILSNWEKVTNSPEWTELDASLKDKFTTTAKNWGIIANE